MSETTYLILWGSYLLSTLIAFLLLWSLTKWQGKLKFFSGLIRVLFLAVMLTPANLSTVPEYMAPASIVALFDFFQGYEEGVLNSSINLGVAVFASVVIYVIYSLILLIVHSRKKA